MPEWLSALSKEQTGPAEFILLAAVFLGALVACVVAVTQGTWWAGGMGALLVIMWCCAKKIDERLSG
jgi:hypothetical protein